MNFSYDPFEDQNKQSHNYALHHQLAAQDDQLSQLHSSLRAAHHQTHQLNAELSAHNELLQQLSGRMEQTEGAFGEATRRVRRLYGELTERRFTWTATVLIALLTILLIYLILI